MGMFDRSGVSVALILLLWVSGLTACGGPPTWVRTPPDDSRFFYTVGIRSNALSLEEGRRQAVSNAVRQLVERFGLEAKAEYQEVKTRFETRVLDALATQSERVRVRDQMVVRWNYDAKQDENEGRTGYDVYVLLRYPKAAWQRERARLQQEAQDRRRRIEQGLREGRMAGEAGHLPHAISTLVRTYRLARAEGTDLDRKALQALRGMLARVQLEIVSGNGQTAVIPDGPPDPLVVRVALSESASSRLIPLTDIPVQLRLIDPHQRFSARVVTGAQGLARWRMPSVARPSARYRAQASLDVRPLRKLLAPLPEDAQEQLRPAIAMLEERAATFQFNAITVERNRSLSLVVQEQNLGEATRRATSSIAASLRAAGFQVLGPWAGERPDWLVIGTIRTRADHGPIPSVHAFRAAADFTVVERQSGQVLVRLNGEAMGYASTESLAGQRALSSLGNLMGLDLVKRLASLASDSRNERPASDDRRTSHTGYQEDPS